MKINGKELRTILNYVLIKEVDDEPLLVNKTTSGILLTTGGLTFNDQTEGHSAIEKNEKVIRVGKIIDVGDECKAIKLGDLVYFDSRSVRPIPASTAEEGTLNIVQTNEANIIAYIRE